MAFNRDIAYGHYRIDAVAEGSLNSVGDRFVIADDLIDSVVAQAKIDSVTRLGDAGDLTGTVAAHPLHAFQDEKGGFDHAVPLFHGDYVTAESGTGLVHSRQDMVLMTGYWHTRKTVSRFRKPLPKTVAFTIICPWWPD